MNDFVIYKRHGNVGVVTINNPPVNALGFGVRSGLVEGLKAGNADSDAGILVLIGGGRTFPAGADITEFGKPMQEPGLSAVIDAYENSEKIVVAAVHGTALGGGLELAFGCDYRCGVENARVGLPEVNLGILPGAGGTQRLPRLVGVEAALDMILTGAMVGGSKAGKLGIFDRIVEGDLLEGAVSYAQELLGQNAPHRRIRDMPIEADAKVFEGARKMMAKRARGFNAPMRCIESVENATKLSFEEGLKAERAIFMDLVSSTQSAAQRYMFFAERQVAKVPDVPRDTPLRDVKQAGVIGAGTMGGGIAMNFANAGIPVTLVETGQEALDRGLSVIKKNYASTVAKGRLSQDDMDARLGRISGSLDYDDLTSSDFVVEAVFENMPLKKEIFTKLDKVCKPGAILATNTSTLDIDEIAAATSRPQDVIGTHFFSPANIMKLLELVRGEKTAKDVIATSMKLSKTISKTGVLVGVCDGFVGNRMLHGYLGQTNALVEEGALPRQIDKVLYDWGWAMGPFAVIDLAGLDVGWRIRKGKAATRGPGDPYPYTVEDQLAEMGRYGQKTGAGWYLYEKGSRVPTPDPEVEKMVLKASADKGIARRDIDGEEIIKRCIYALVNVGAQILDEGIASRAADIDVIYHYGYGFPRYRGGPMFYADSVGLDNVLEDIKKFHAKYGDEWKPAPLIESLVAEGKSFSDL